MRDAYCVCGCPTCRSCGPTQGWHIHTVHCYAPDSLVPACGQLAYDEEPDAGDEDPTDDGEGTA